MLRQQGATLTPKMAEALRLLAHHGDGDVAHNRPTALTYGVPCINLHTAKALDKAGLARVFEQSHYEVWGSIELLEAGKAAALAAEL